MINMCESFSSHFSIDPGWRQQQTNRGQPSLSIQNQPMCKCGRLMQPHPEKSVTAFKSSNSVVENWNHSERSEQLHVHPLDSLGCVNVGSVVIFHLVSETIDLALKVCS